MIPESSLFFGDFLVSINSCFITLVVLIDLLSTSSSFLKLGREPLLILSRYSCSSEVLEAPDDEEPLEDDPLLELFSLVALLKLIGVGCRSPPGFSYGGASF